ncbi:MAG: hypothetical protein ACLTOX_03755 [Streptococcus thermophilus]
MTRILNFITLRKQHEADLETKQAIEKYNADAKAKYKQPYCLQ